MTLFFILIEFFETVLVLMGLIPLRKRMEEFRFLPSEELI
jgi:hypothetical protein